MDNRYLIAGFLLVIPTIVLLIVPMYNRVNPELFGLPFFYWFQGIWLFLAAIMYVIAAKLITQKEEEAEAA